MYTSMNDVIHCCENYYSSSICMTSLGLIYPDHTRLMMSCKVLSTDTILLHNIQEHNLNLGGEMYDVIPFYENFAPNFAPRLFHTKKHPPYSLSIFAHFRPVVTLLVVSGLGMNKDLQRPCKMKRDDIMP